MNLEHLVEILTGRLAAPMSWAMALVLGVVVLAVGILIYRLAFTLLHGPPRRTGTSLDDLAAHGTTGDVCPLLELGAAVASLCFAVVCSFSSQAA